MAPSLKSSINKRDKALADMQAMLPGQKKKKIVEKPVVKKKVVIPVESAFADGGGNGLTAEQIRVQKLVDESKKPREATAYTKRK